MWTIWNIAESQNKTVNIELGVGEHSVSRPCFIIYFYLQNSMQMSAENVAHIFKPLYTLCTKDRNIIGIYRCSLNISDLMQINVFGVFCIFTNLIIQSLKQYIKCKYVLFGVFSFGPACLRHCQRIGMDVWLCPLSFQINARLCLQWAWELFWFTGVWWTPLCHVNITCSRLPFKHFLGKGSRNPTLIDIIGILHSTTETLSSSVFALLVLNTTKSLKRIFVWESGEFFWVKCRKHFWKCAVKMKGKTVFLPYLALSKEFAGIQLAQDHAYFRGDVISDNLSAFISPTNKVDMQQGGYMRAGICKVAK